MQRDDSEQWDLPVPFADSNLPAFPLHTLPPVLRDFAEATAEAHQTPEDLPAVLTTAVVSLAASRMAKVQAKPGWLEPLNLYFAVALPSGEGKSPDYREVMAPVHAFEDAEGERVAPQIAAAEERVECAKERLKILRNAAAKKGDAAARSAAEAAAVELAELERAVPTMPQLIIGDATPEVIALRLHEQGERLGLFSSEGGPFEMFAGRYSDGKPNIDLPLMAYSGDPHKVDRISRRSFKLRDPALTMALTVQPEVIAGLAAKPGFRERGFLPRICFVIPASRVGSRAADPPPIPEAIREAYAQTVRRMLAQPVDRSENTVVLGLDKDAGGALVAFKESIEPRLRPGEDLFGIRDWVGKLAGVVIRLAGILHLADHAGQPEQPFPREIAAPTFMRAVALGNYFLAHARAAFGIMGVDAKEFDARHVAAWLRRHPTDTVSVRDIYRAFPGRFAGRDAVEPVVDVLAERAILRPVPSDKTGPGRSPSPVYAINPHHRLTQLTQPPTSPGSVNSVNPERPAESRERFVVQIPAAVAVGELGEMDP